MSDPSDATRLHPAVRFLLSLSDRRRAEAATILENVRQHLPPAWVERLEALTQPGLLPSDLCRPRGYVEVSEADLLELLAEREQLRGQVTSLQASNTAYLGRARVAEAERDALLDQLRRQKESLDAERAAAQAVAP